MSHAPVAPFLQALHRGAEQLWLQAHEHWPDLRVEVLPETDSTNTQLMQAARQGRRDTVVMSTAHQTAGRGRLGRQWTDEQGQSLMFSVGTRLLSKDASGLSLAVGIALAEALGAPVQLKWPNDLWVQHQGQWRKLGGILTEVAHDGAEPYVVVGAGINLRTPSGAAPASAAPIGLVELGLPAQADHWFPTLAFAVLEALRQFMATGFAPWVSRFSALDALRNAPVRLSDGREGIAQGVAPDGALLMTTEDQTQAVHSQEVSVRPC